MRPRNRRAFLSDVGSGMLVAGLGSALAFDMGLARADSIEGSDRLSFGALEPLATLMQETPADKLMPLLVERLRNGTDLRTLTAAGALANARAFGGEDYVGFHTFMALAPAYHMSRALPEAERPLPVLKVLYRNAERIQAEGGCEHEVLKPVKPSKLPGDRNGSEFLQDLTRRADRDAAESALAAMVKQSPDEAWQNLLHEIHDDVDVHRVVLAWRAWSTLDLVGQEHADTLLRQSIRYCVKNEKYLIDNNRPLCAIREQLPKLFDQYKLLNKPLGSRIADDKWIEDFSNLLYSAPRAKAADAAAAALADGISPESIGEAISLAANRLVLHDPGRREARPDKPVGSVHGDSVGVHASDAANAWRNIARAAIHRNAAASLIVGAFHTAGMSSNLNKDPYPLPEQLELIEDVAPPATLSALNNAILANDQMRACALATRYTASGGDVQPLFHLLLQFATSEDGALHAEKYYRTVTEEYATIRPAFRGRQLAALARVTASEFGKPAPGYRQARELLGA